MRILWRRLLGDVGASSVLLEDHRVVQVKNRATGKWVRVKTVFAENLPHGAEPPRDAGKYLRGEAALPSYIRRVVDMEGNVMYPWASQGEGTAMQEDTSVDVDAMQKKQRDDNLRRVFG